MAMLYSNKHLSKSALRHLEETPDLLICSGYDEENGPFLLAGFGSVAVSKSGQFHNFAGHRVRPSAVNVGQLRSGGEGPP